MQFFTTIALLAAATTSLAAPAPEAAVGQSMMVQGSTWTMQNFKRVCTKDGRSCDYSFAVNTNDGSRATPCAYKVTGNPAARQTYQNIKCGAFTVGSTWSGQFGAGKGFQTLSVVRGKQIVYPGYTDAQLASGQVVKPDQSYTPQNLP